MEGLLGRDCERCLQLLCHIIVVLQIVLVEFTNAALLYCMTSALMTIIKSNIEICLVVQESLV
jgi:hypothetical protein